MERRDGVEELDPPALGRQAGDRLLQRLGDEPVVIHRNVHHLRLVRGEGAECADIGRTLGEHDIARIHEDPRDQVEGLL